MQYNQEEIKNVWDRYQKGTATSDDLALLESWYLQFEIKDLVELNVSDIERRLNEVKNNLPQEQPRKLWIPYAAVASLVFLLGIGYYLYHQSTLDHLRKEAAIAGIRPGRNKAILKLANGSEISLGDVQSGTIAEQSGAEITKTERGELVYKEEGQDITNPVQNSISVPNGGKYKLQLPDGTKVWLNAASSLSYPVTFAGQKQRRVELIGEAYFEVAKDKTKPFLVHSMHQNVQVLGTHFNINAYENEPNVKTTLLEGSIAVTSAGRANLSRVLKPGEQSALNGKTIGVTPVNVLLATDWKNEEFRFKEESLTSILRKVSRWYDVKIVYGNEIKEMPTFSGSVSRLEDVSTILKMLEEAGDVQFSIKGKVIYVSK